MFGSRVTRGMFVVLLAILAASFAEGTTLAAVQIGQKGDPGSHWSVADTSANPGAVCDYAGGGAMGSTYLTHIKVPVGPDVFGKTSALTSVGYMIRLQHYESGHWVTLKKSHGKLWSSPASDTTAAMLPGSGVTIPIATQSTNPSRYRVFLRLTWYTSTAQVDGTRDILIQHYKAHSGATAASCKGRLINH
jgi:hypothetical protein